MPWSVADRHYLSKLVNFRSASTDALFESYPTDKPVLKGDVRFWCCAWSNKKIGIWEDFGPVGLKFLEYLLIGVAGTVFPNHLLNTEGN